MLMYQVQSQCFCVREDEVVQFGTDQLLLNYYDLENHVKNIPFDGKI